MITQATPIGDRPQQKEEEDADDEGDGEPGARTERGFSMELTRDQQKHYGSQFGEDGTAVPSMYLLIFAGLILIPVVCVALLLFFIVVMAVLALFLSSFIAIFISFINSFGYIL